MLKILVEEYQKQTELGTKWIEIVFKSEQLRCDCHLPVLCDWSPLMASPSRRCPGAIGLMAGGMCSFLPLISIPGASLAIFWASLIWRVRGRSPALSTVKEKVVGSRLLVGCSSSRCLAMEFVSTLRLISLSDLLSPSIFQHAAGYCLMIMSNLYCWSGFNLVSIKVVVDRAVSFD